MTLAVLYIQKACKHDDVSHANTMHLVRAARIIREGISSLSIHLMNHLQKNASKMYIEQHVARQLWDRVIRQTLTMLAM